MLKLQHRVLVCPLDWGLGHASRMIPVIHSLIDNDFEVIIGADKLPFQLLKIEFPALKFIRFPSATILYSKSGFLLGSMIQQFPKMLFQIFKEHRFFEKIIMENGIDIVVSDNRFGLWNKNVFSVFITHQIQIKMPKGFSFMEKPIALLNRYFIEKFNQCWIPDFFGEMNLSGDLSHRCHLPVNASFIGPLTRFSSLGKINYEIESIDVLVIISGPEPQRSIFENQVLDQLLLLPYKTIIVSGLPGKDICKKISDNIKLISHVETSEMMQLICSSKYIICRSGYTSVMDLVFLKKKAILIPTPGQTEQEYLGKFMMKKGWFYSVSQKDFVVEKALSELQKLNPVFPEISLDILNENIEILKNI